MRHLPAEAAAAAPEKILALVLTGVDGASMWPLTASEAEPRLRCGKSLRVVDFVLSNLVNSGIEAIHLLAQHEPASLAEHVRDNWAQARSGRVISVVSPRQEQGEYFRGSADAIYRHLALIEQHAPDIVAIFAADQVYRMDVRQMVRFHRKRDADVTVAARQVPIEQASSFDIIATGYKDLIWDIQEKPDLPLAVPACPEFAYSSMGNYLFNTDVLLESLEQALRRGETDIGKHILPRLIHTHQVHAYDFTSNRIPGVQAHEEQAYWRDVRSMEAYVAAHCDMIGSAPRFNLQNPHWPIGSLLSAPQHTADTSRAQRAEICSDHLIRAVPTASAFPAQYCALTIGTA